MGIDRSSRAKIVDGKKFSTRLLQEIAADVADLKAKSDCVPGLAVGLVGDDAAGAVYINSKKRKAVKVGRVVRTSLPAKHPVRKTQLCANC